MNAAAPVSVRPHVLFRLDQSWFVVNALAVREMLALPELTAVAEAPPYIAGVLNLRGRVLPVMDLRHRFGEDPQPHRIEESIVVLEWKGVFLGVIVSELADVCDLTESQLLPVPDYGAMSSGLARFVSGMARVSQGLAMQLHLENLVQLPPLTSARASQSGGSNGQSAGNGALGRTAEIYRERANSYAQEPETEDRVALIPVAVVGLNGEFFGLDLGVVREFADLRELAPVPCCPPHVLGQMILRGDLLTVLDLRVVLGLSTAGAAEPRKVVIVQWEAGIAGLAVHEVYDVIYLRPADLIGVPVAAEVGADDYRKGAAAYRDRMMCLPDLPKLLNRADLIVDEEI